MGLRSKTCRVRVNGYHAGCSYVGRVKELYILSATKQGAHNFRTHFLALHCRYVVPCNMEALRTHSIRCMFLDQGQTTPGKHAINIIKPISTSLRQILARVQSNSLPGTALEQSANTVV